jgi:hypothetical protein
VITVVFSLEAGTGILLGQSDGLMLLAATLAVEAAGHQQPLLLAPLLLKPQLLSLVPPALIAAPQWRMLVALCASALIVLLGSIAVAGPGHLLDAVGSVTAPSYAHLDATHQARPAACGTDLVRHRWGASFSTFRVTFIAASIASNGSVSRSCDGPASEQLMNNTFPRA